jgi:PPK2 family polyphosphate:nucleotide phosphotransferase
MDFKAYRVKPGDKLNLEKFDANDHDQFKGSKEDGKDRLAKLRQELIDMQEALYAGHKHKLLVVFQAMDGGGKDGTIRSVFEGVNPQGVHVASFKVPTLPEADHDFLWRVHAQAPGKGEITVFNRSHYEEVLVVRVHKLAPEEAWRRHYRQICDFEQMLVEEGTTILKFYLHIDLEEQAKRFLERIDDPCKQWKFNPGDLDERKLWPEYMRAFEDAIEKTSTEDAPWYVVPANDNWYRDLVVIEAIVAALKDLDLKYPPAAENLTQYRTALVNEER